MTYANAAPDTDLLVRSLPTGVGAAWLLRSPEASRTIETPLAIPAGHRLERGPSGDVAVLDRAGAHVAQVTTATAVDADGQPVRVTSRVEGRTVVHDVDHAAGDVAYPVTVDPLVYVVTWSDGGQR